MIICKRIIFVRNPVHSLPVDLLVDSLDLLEELVEEVLSRLVPPPVVGEVRVCNSDNVDEREGGKEGEVWLKQLISQN